MIYLLWAFLAYLLYKLVFDFILPISRATRRIKKQFREFHNQDGSHQQQTTATSGFSPGSGQHRKPAQKDYIDFEEIN